MWPQLGGHLIVRPYPKPLGQDHQPAGAELGGVTDAGGAAVGTERIGGAIVPLVVFPLLYDGAFIRDTLCSGRHCLSSLRLLYKSALHQKNETEISPIENFLLTTMVCV